MIGFCIDNISTGKLSNISHLKKILSLLDLQDVEKSYDAKSEAIFNLACPASPVAYQKNPISTIQTAILGAINALQLAEKNKARVFQASTSEVYGDAKVHPQNEEYWGNVNPIGVRACYDEGKRCGETLFFDYNRQHKVDIRVGKF